MILFSNGHWITISFYFGQEIIFDNKKNIRTLEQDTMPQRRISELFVPLSLRGNKNHSHVAQNNGVTYNESWNFVYVPNENFIIAGSLLPKKWIFFLRGDILKMLNFVIQFFLHAPVFFPKRNYWSRLWRGRKGMPCRTGICRSSYSSKKFQESCSERFEKTFP